MSWLLTNFFLAIYTNTISRDMIVLDMLITRGSLQPHNPVGFPCSAGFVNDLELIGRKPQTWLYQNDQD